MNIKIYTFVFLLIICISSVVVHYLGGHSIQLHLLNSDALFLPTFFSDIFNNHGDIRSWSLPNSPYFFPDFGIYLIAYILGSNSYIQIIIYSIIQIVLTFLAILFLTYQINHKNSFFTASLITILLIWLALFHDQPFVYLLTSVFHYGNFLLSIVFISIWVKSKNFSLQRNDWLINLLLIFFAFIGCLSDNLFIVQAIIPFIGTIIYISIIERAIPQKKIILLIICIAGLLGARFLKIFGLIDFSSKFSINFDRFSQHMIEVLSSLNARLSFSSISGVIFLIYILIVLYTFINPRKVLALNKSLFLIIIFSFFCICSTYGAFLFIPDLGFATRYFIPAYFWPVIIVFIFFSSYLSLNYWVFSLILSIGATIVIAFESYYFISNNKVKLDYYPDNLPCIDNALESVGAKNGIANYWDSNYIQNFSRLKLQIASHYTDLSEVRSVTSKHFFKREYDFAIISPDVPPFKISSEALIRINGNPEKIAECGKVLVYLYPYSKLRTQ